jgi:hypothetical protein
MGLLDDAIREHLELKRRHGAEASELADLEKEAFGPARKGPEPLEVPAEPAEPVAPVEPVEPAPASEAPAPPPPASDTVIEADDLGDEVDPVAEDLAWEDAETEAPPPPREEPPPPPPPAAAETPAPPAETPEGEDVLEETPEFLQETPEHDRLWFEQKPPRDFDF